MFKDREQAALELAQAFKKIKLVNPLVLAIPRGGVITGAVLAMQLNAELDVILSRKLRAPLQPELAIGAISENGNVYLNSYAKKQVGVTDQYLAEEQERQKSNIHSKSELFRKIKSRAPTTGRSVIITDDGMATGSTLIAALDTVRSTHPKELIAAVPVAPKDRQKEIEKHCDRFVCLSFPEPFWAISEFYEHFEQVEDAQAVKAFTECNQRLGL